MARLVTANEATAAQRRVYFHLVDATDGITAETGEASGQPQISTNGGAWTNTGIGTLSAIGNGRYYADLTQTAVATAGDIIETRYKSANTAEAVGDQVMVIAADLTVGYATAADVGALATESTYTIQAGGDLVVTNGSVSSGDYTDTQTHDESYFVVAESATGDPMEVECTFTADDGAAETPVAILFNGRYSGGAQHKIRFYAYNHETAANELVSDNSTELSSSTTDVSRRIDLRPEHINQSTGVVLVCLCHYPESGGNASHRLYVDRLAVVTTTATPALTAGDIANAVWDDTLANHLGTGTTGEALSVCSGGAGTYAITIHVQDAEAAPLPGATVVVRDSTGATTITGGTTDAGGDLTVALDAETYKVYIGLAGYAFTVPETMVVSADATHTFSGAVAASSVDVSTYEARPLRRQKIAYNSANTVNPIKHQLIVGGEKVTPTAAAITVYGTASSTALVSAQAMTISGTVVTYAIDTTTTASWPIGTGYRGEITYTYGGVSYVRVVMIDVAKFVLTLDIGADQLIALDDNVRGMLHDGDDDLSELIEACRDDIQFMLEVRAHDDGQLAEEMVLDHSRVAIPARYYILSRLYSNKRDAETAEMYRKQFDSMWTQMLAGVKYDTGQSGTEAGQQGGVQSARIVM